PLTAPSLLIFNDTLSTPIYTLSLHDALPIFHTLYVGVSSRACAPLADTSFQSITPRKTIEIQNRTVFAVELEFTLSSLILSPETTNQTLAFFFRPLPLFACIPFTAEESCRRFRPIPLAAARPYPTHI